MIENCKNCYTIIKLYGIYHKFIFFDCSIEPNIRRCFSHQMSVFLKLTNSYEALLFSLASLEPVRNIHVFAKKKNKYCSCSLALLWCLCESDHVVHIFFPIFRPMLSTTGLRYSIQLQYSTNFQFGRCTCNQCFFKKIFVPLEKN